MEGIQVFEVHARSYMNHIEMETMRGQEHKEERPTVLVNQAVGDSIEDEDENTEIVNVGSTRKRKRIDRDPEDEPLPKRVR